jgi:hypothetical protein
MAASTIEVGRSKLRDLRDVEGIFARPGSSIVLLLSMTIAGRMAAFPEAIGAILEQLGCCAGLLPRDRVRYHRGVPLTPADRKINSISMLTRWLVRPYDGRGDADPWTM